MRKLKLIYINTLPTHRTLLFAMATASIYVFMVNSQSGNNM